MTLLSLQQQAARIAASTKGRRLPPRRLTPAVFVARGLLVRALRKAGLHHALHREPCTVGIVGVEQGAVDAVSSAVRDIMGANLVGNLGFDVVVYDRTGNRRRDTNGLRSLVMDAAKGGERAGVLFPSMEDVSPAFLASAEGVVTLGPVDRTILRGAFMSTVKRVPDAAGLDLVATLPLDLLDSVVVAGRSVERSVEVARRLLAAVEAETAGDGSNVPEPEQPLDPGPRLVELSGLGEVGDWGGDLVRDLADYRAGTIPWRDVDRGVLVAGPPGVGKTLFAGALGRSCGVPVHIHSCAVWQAKGHLGDMLKAMKRAFDEARKAAPCILFLDETDAFGSRTDPGDKYSAYTRQVIDALLEQLDGAVGREGVVVVGATNHPELVDPALLRPGRFDRVLHMRLPDRTARVGILRHHLRDALGAADLVPIAERLEGSTGAEIELLVRDARRRARKRREPLAVADVEAGLPPEESLSTALHRRVCVHEAAHLVVGALLADESGMDPVEATVDRRAREGSAGGTRFERRRGFDRTRASFVAEITVLLAGTAAEEEIIGNRGEGAGGQAGSDLALATAIAVALEASLGLGDGLVHLVADFNETGSLLARDRMLRARVRALLDECFARARDLVRQERETVERVAAVLAAEGRAGPDPSRLEWVMEGRG